MKLLPNLLGMWVYEDERAPAYDPPAMTQYQGKYFVHPSATGAFYRWAAAQEQRTWRYQDEGVWPFGGPPTESQLRRRRLHDVVVTMADELCAPASGPRLKQ